jgi:RNA polymerase sigma-70 factor (ECF subfamily)
MQSAVSRASIPRGASIPSFHPLASEVETAGQRNDSRSWRSDPDVATMERVRDGDKDAFQALFKKYNGAIVKFAYRFLGSRDRAEEITQTVFLQLYRARKRYRPKARFATFLYRIATNLCLNELRRFDYSGKIDSLDAPEEPEFGGTSFADRLPGHDSAGAAELITYREIANRLKKALQQLPPKQRAALLLSRIDGSSYQEVADNLHTSVSAVKSLIFRATSALRRSLSDLL